MTPTELIVRTVLPPSPKRAVCAARGDRPQTPCRHCSRIPPGHQAKARRRTGAQGNGATLDYFRAWPLR